MFDNLLTAVSKKIGEVQSDFRGPMLNLFSRVLSFIVENSDPNDEPLQEIFDAQKALLSLLGKTGSSQDAEAQWLATQFNKGNIFVDNAAIAEAFASLSDEAKAEVYLKILNSLSSDIVSHLLDN